MNSVWPIAHDGGAATGPAARLSPATLPGLPASVQRPGYDRDATRIGIVHFGPGAFHRAHQAVYVDDLLAHDPGWAVCAVSLRSPDVRDALQPQDGLYTLALLGERPSLRVIGSIREVLCAPQQRRAVMSRLVDPDVRLVTLTITEKGYCLSADGIDAAHPDVSRDLVQPEQPITAIGWLVAGLRERRERGLAPPCSAATPPTTAAAARCRYARRVDRGLAGWIEDHVGFPRSMVDSITPATDDALRAQVASALGVEDAWPVQREAYAQWVVEDDFRAGRPPFERVGVVISSEVEGWDRAKLRLLNAPHSALAYLGLLTGMGTVAEAMREPVLAGFIERIMREDILPTLALPVGFDPDAYIGAVLERFRNPAIAHLLSQIAWDGSQNAGAGAGTMADALAQGGRIDRLALVVAGWLHFVVRQARAGAELSDPMSAQLLRIGAAATGDAAHDVAGFLALESVFGALATDARFVAAAVEAYAALGDGGPAAVARALAAAVQA